MTIRISKLLCALLGGVVISQLTGCAAVVLGGAAVAVAATEDRRSTGAFVDDENIENKSLLAVKQKLGDEVHINITSYNRRVLLTGEAKTEAAKRTAEEEVLKTAGVKAVSNEMAVGPLKNIFSSTNDTGITTLVKSRLITEGKFQSNHIKVVTENNVVYLIGIVKRAEAASAAEIASTTKAVLRVVKVFEYLD